MRTLFVLTVSFLFEFMVACSSSNGQATEKLSPEDFNKKLSAMKDCQLLDVRTKEEFDQGHLKGALNIDYNGNDFDRLSSYLDKNKPVMVYCLAGGRSAGAAAMLSSKGFKTIYDMKGGYSAWASSGLPVDKPDGLVESKGMSLDEFQKSIPTNKIVLVEFGTQWCPPCKKLSASLDSVEKKQNAQVVIMKIDIDKNKELSKLKGVSTFPTLFVYKNGVETKKHEGYADEKTLSSYINAK